MGFIVSCFWLIVGIFISSGRIEIGFILRLNEGFSRGEVSIGAG